MEKNLSERVFSVELKSKANLKSITMTNGGIENVLVEGSLGDLVSAEFAENIILEITGTNGVLRINLSQDDISKNQQQKEEVKE